MSNRENSENLTPRKFPAIRYFLQFFMNIRCKFDGGKFYNCIQRGSFQHRTYGAGLRFQLGPDWSSKAWSKTTGTEPGELRVAFGEKMKRKSTTKYKEQHKKAK